MACTCEKRFGRLEHYDYIGSIHYSDETKVYFGKILNIADIVTYKGNSRQELTQEFIKAVHGYAGSKGCSYLDLDKKVK